MDLLIAALSSLITAIPTLLVYLTLLVLAVTRWNRHPRVSMYASTAAVMMLLLDLISHVGFTILPHKLLESGRTSAQMGVILGIVSGITGVINAIAVVLLTVAVFSDRPPSAEVQGPFSPGR